MIDRFKAKYSVAENGCHLWTANKNRTGYGKFKLRNGTQALAHRMAWEFAHGSVPEGLFVLHKCDVPACVNPDHLFLGTHGDNMRDMVSKGRGLLGGLNGRAKLTSEDVAVILKSSDSTASLAREYNVSESAVRDVRKGRNWSQCACEHGAMLSIHPVKG